MSEPILVADKLAVSYGKVDAVRGVSISIAPGSIVSVIGANGAGKSTTLNALMGLLPSSGGVRYDGRELRYVSPEARVAAGLCLVPEKRELFATMSVADNLILGGYRATVAELHPQEYAALTEVMLPYPVTCRQMDGTAMALALTPPDPRRGLMLIDPSYEVKSDYATIPKLIADVHRKWNVGVITLWYPILADHRHKPMIEMLAAADFPKALRHEVRFPPARDGHGMIGSGLFILSTPYGTEAEATRISSLFRR